MDVQEEASNGHAVRPADVESVTSSEMCNDDVEVTSCLSTPLVCNDQLCMRGVKGCSESAVSCFKRHTETFKLVLYFVVILLYVAYVSLALVRDPVRSRPLLALSVFMLACLTWYILGAAICEKVQKLLDLASGACGKKGVKWTQRFLAVLVFVGIGLVVWLFVKPRPHQLMSLLGLVVFLLFLLIFSKHPSKVRFRTVFWGLLLQFILGILLLRTSWGSAIANAAGGQVQQFISYSDKGAEFVFGEAYIQHKFAFKILPVVIYFSGAVSVLYHLGVMQAVIRKVAWIMRITMGTSASESVCAAGNIFVGMTEAPILVRPFIEDMTPSELHAMMTAGFATIAGSVLAIYIMLGVSAQHLMSACVMNAPMALMAAKVFYPETEESKTLGKDLEMGASTSRNVLDAAASGATLAVKLVGNIAANLIAFIGLLAFVNAAFSWFGSMIDHPELTFQLLLSYLYLPVVIVMGVDWADAGRVSELLGMKTFINEFIAYEKLSELIYNREHCIYPHISVRSEVICTYALCGFANLSAIGIQLGGLRALAPSRTADITKVALRALVAGTVTCFITASVAGLLTTVDETTACPALNSTLSSSTVKSISYDVHLNTPPGFNVSLY